LKILYLTDQLYRHGGIEKVLTQKVNYLADIAGDQVTVLTYQQEGRPPVYELSDKVRIRDLNINYEIGKSYFSLTNLLKIPAHISALRNTIRQVQPDVIVSCSFGPDFYFLPFVCGKIPVIKEFHSTRYFADKANKITSQVMRKLNDYVETQYTRLIVLNEDEKPFYKSANVEIIPNPAEFPSQYCPLTEHKIISAGRITSQKNFEDLVNVSQRLQTNFPDWQIHIYGDDYLDRKASIEKKILELNLENQIQFKGTTSDLKRTFLNYSIYAMTSNHETFPMVLLEALSVGLPVVSYRCPTGPDRIITHGEDGFIVPYKNLDIFTKKLEKLMTDENLRRKMGAKGRDNVQRFNIDTVMQQWRTLFEQVITQKNPQCQPQP